MSHLSRYLEEHGVLYPEQIAEATRRQQIYGGSLDTVLLELELIKPEALGQLLEHACGFPIAPPNLLVGRHNRPWTQIPEDLQRSRWVEPLTMDGEEVIVAVHPDLPNDLLGGLLRSVRRLRLVVTPECCLEKVAAERNGSVVPQRYAILSAAYLAAVRRPPPRTQPIAAATDDTAVGSIEVHDKAPVDAPDGPPPQTEGPRPRRNTMVAAAPPMTPRGTLVSVSPPVEPAPEPTAASPAEPEEGPSQELSDGPVIEHEHGPDITDVMAAPVETTDIMPVPPLAAAAPERDEADIRRRLVPVTATLQTAESRDAAIAALVDAAMVLSPRAGLFRVRGDELVGLSNPHSHLRDIGGTVVGTADGSLAATVLAQGSAVADAADPDLQLATSCPANTPCALQRVDVRGRPVLIVYLDRDGKPIETIDTECLRDLADAAGQVFEDIVKRRRATSRERSRPSPQAPRVPPPPEVGGESEAGSERGWGPAPARVRAAYGDGLANDSDEPAAVEARSTSRVVTPDEQAPMVPPVVPTESSPPPRKDWRLTPQLAAQALEREASGPHLVDDDDAAEPPATLEDEGIPIRPPSHDVSGPQRTALAPRDISEPEPEPEPADEAAADDTATEDAQPPASPSDDAPSSEEPEPDDLHIPSSRPTMEIASLGNLSDDDANDEDSDDADADASSSASGLSRPTVVSEPPPPPLPPPPPSAVDDSEAGARRRRSSTISGLPPPELGGRSTATKRQIPRQDDVLPRGDEEVEIIPLARPITPTTARGRIELEDEDWMPTGAPLANDSAQAEIDATIDRLIAGDADVDDLMAFGNPGLLRLLAPFPGHLEVMRRDLRSLPPPSAHGPLIRAVIAVGAPIVPHLIDLLEHPNPDARFYAAFVFHELRDVRCMRPLAKLAFDANGDVRIVSMRVLETYRRHEGFSDAASVVREQLDTDNRGRQLHASRAAGTLRDIGSVPQLIDLLSSGDRFLQEASLESLCSITGQQHGLKPHRWRGWYDEQGHLHRVEWIIDSLRHRDLPVRRWAADELVRITGHRVPFSPMGDKRAREVAANAWTEWWQSRGREIFSV